jgi:hypothetical protein
LRVLLPREQVMVVQDAVHSWRVGCGWLAALAVDEVVVVGRARKNESTGRNRDVAATAAPKIELSCGT